MRLNKYLSDAGFCSRREADRLIQAGRVQVDGQPGETGMQVEPSSVVCVDGKVIRSEEKKVLLLYHKPKGVECTTDKRVKDNVIAAVDYPLRVYYAGRLDKDSRGLLLLTNRGELVDQMMRAGNFHEKEYEVLVDKPITPQFLRSMSEGVPILGTITRSCNVWKKGEKTFGIVLTQGLNRQIRRMCQYLGYEVKSLKRLRIMNLRLGDLEEGAWREATREEILDLERALKERKPIREEYRGGKPVKHAGKYRTPSGKRNGRK